MVFPSISIGGGNSTTPSFEALTDISASLPYIDDQDMAELMKQTVLLLEEMSEEDFSELVFVPAEEEDEPDWEGLI